VKTGGAGWLLIMVRMVKRIPKEENRPPGICKNLNKENGDIPLHYILKSCTGSFKKEIKARNNTAVRLSH